MTASRLLAWACGASVAALLGAPLPVLAQSEVSTPNPITTNGHGILGINVVTRGVHHDEKDLISGPQGEVSSIYLVRSLGNGMSYGSSLGSLGPNHYFEHNFRATASVRWEGSLSGQFAVVVLFDKTYVMRSVEGSSVLTNTYLDKDSSLFRDAGFTASGNRQFEFINHDGVRVVFEASTAYLSGRIGEVNAKYVEFPNGEFISFKYETVTPPINYDIPDRPDVISRLVEVLNSRGYGLRFSYVNPQTMGSRDIRKLTIASVTPIHRVCTYETSCTEIASAPVTYTYQQQTNGYGNTILHLSVVNRPDDTVSTYTHGSPREGVITTSSGADGTPDYIYDTGMVDVQAAVGETTIGPKVYRVTDSFGRITRVNPEIDTIAGSVIIEPNGATSTHVSYYDPTFPIPHNDPVILQSTDPIGRSTSYTYEISTKIRSITYPEGNSILLTRDARGNVIEQKSIAKPGSGIPDITSAWGFAVCDGANYRYCNKPLYEIDGNGHRTDFQYHQESGSPSLIVYPPDTNGVRGAIEYSYSAFAPADRYSLPPGITVPSVWLRTAERQCRNSGLSGAPGSFVFSCAAADLTTKAFIYEPSAPTAPSRHLLVGLRVASATEQALTCFSYDAFGRVTSETAPGAGLTACHGQ